MRQVRLRDPAALHGAAPRRGAAVASESEIARAELPFEFMLNALRLKDGFELARFSERTGLPLSAIERPLAEAERRGLVERDLTLAAADAARLRLPERPAAAVPAGRVPEPPRRPVRDARRRPCIRRT